MANDLVVKLLLKTGAFSTDLKTAKSQVQNFQQGCQTAGRSLDAFGKGLGMNLGSLAKFGTAMGAAALAGKELKAILDSSQTTSDEFTQAIAGAKGVLDQFNTSIATMDFSAFKNGLWDIYDAAKAVAKALDELNDAKVGYDYFSTKYANEFESAYATFKDKNSTPEQKVNAQKKMEEIIGLRESDVSDYGRKIMNTFRKTIVQKAGGPGKLEEKDVTIAMFEEFLRIKLSSDSEKLEKEYKNKYKQIISDYNKYTTSSKAHQFITSGDNPKYVAIYGMLESMKDEQVQQLAEMLKEYQRAQIDITKMTERMNKAIKGGDDSPKRTTGSTKTQKEELQIQEGSLAYWKKILSDETTYRDALVKDTEEWNAHNEKVKEAAAEIEKIEGKIKEIKAGPSEGSKAWYEDMLQNAIKTRDALQYMSDEWKKADEKVKMIESSIKSLTNIEVADWLNSMKWDTATLADWEKLLSIMKEMLNTLPLESDEFKELSSSIATISKYVDGFKGVTDSLQDANIKAQNLSQALGSIGSMFGSLSSLASSFGTETGDAFATVLDSLGAVAQGIQQFVQIQQAAAMASGTASASGLPFPYNLAAIATVISTIAGVFAKIHSITGTSGKAGNFANGGIIGGQSFTGDRLSANVNSGEMILNRTQQANLFRMANGGNGGGNTVQFHISGTDLVGVLNNNSRKTRLTR